MLGKLISQDLKLSIKEVMGVSLFLIASSVFVVITNKLNIPTLSGLSIFSYIISIIAIFVLILIITYKIGYESIYGNEGYLTNVLPVSATKIVISKLIVCVILITICFLAIMATIFIFIISFISIHDILVVIQTIFLTIGILFEVDNGYLLSLFILIFFLVLTGSLTSIVIFFYSATIFNSFKIKKYKTLALFGTYIVLTMIVNLGQNFISTFIFAGMNDFLSIHIMLGAFLGWNIIVIVGLTLLNIRAMETGIDIE